LAAVNSGLDMHARTHATPILTETIERVRPQAVAWRTVALIYFVFVAGLKAVIVNKSRFKWLETESRHRACVNVPIKLCNQTRVS